MSGCVGGCTVLFFFLKKEEKKSYLDGVNMHLTHRLHLI